MNSRKLMKQVILLLSACSPTDRWTLGSPFNLRNFCREKNSSLSSRKKSPSRPSGVGSRVACVEYVTRKCRRHHLSTLTSILIPNPLVSYSSVFFNESLGFDYSEKPSYNARKLHQTFRINGYGFF